MKAVYIDSGQVSVERAACTRAAIWLRTYSPGMAGICNTDLELQRGYYGFSGIPGHEFVGVVTEAETDSLVGQRVAGDINLACGQCHFCDINLGRHCEERTVLGIVKHPGAFAEYLTLPESNLHCIPAHVPDEQAVFVEPLAAACEILDQIRILNDEPVAVLGDGKLGLLIAQVLRAHGASVTLYGRHAAKLAIAQAFGAQTSISEDWPRATYDKVVESTGSPAGLRQAVSMVRPRGTVIMKSTVHGEVSIDTAPVIVNEITLVGSRCGRFEPAIELLSSGKIDVSRMLSAEYALEDAPRAFAKAATRGVLKVLLRNG